MVFYRKYRPQTIGDLDSAIVRETLYAVLGSVSVPHAFLFTGPKGLGKTSTARIIAKVVNCENPKPNTQGIKIEPCNICDACVSITNGSNIDVLEIDGASNRGIDEIRDLREKVKLSPSAAKKKVYIIDEVHMLTTEAFNALLKTIEEPPSHVMFLFCTTEPQKVPATILSRCFHLAFKLATQGELIHSLERIVLGEKLQIDTEALGVIAQLAEGGFRDAAKLLEEVSTLAGDQKVTKQFVEEKLHTAGVRSFVLAMVVHLSKKDTLSALQLVTVMQEQGVDSKYFLGQLMNELHAILLATAGVNTDTSRKTSMSVQEIGLLMALLTDAYMQMKSTVIQQLPLEMAIILWGESAQNAYSINSNPATVSEQSGKHTMDTLLKKQHAIKVDNILRPKKEEKPIINSEVTVTHTQSDITATSGDTKVSLMENVIYKIKPINHSLAGVLRGCSIKSVSDTEVIFETPYKFHKERLEEKKSYEIIEKAIREITGKQLKILASIKV